VSETFLVGNVDSTGLQLVNVAKHCRDSGIAVCGPGQPISVIGETIRYGNKVFTYINIFFKVTKCMRCVISHMLVMVIVNIKQTSICSPSDTNFAAPAKNKVALAGHTCTGST